MLPSPEKTRFQPLRSGLINLFKYENQEFWYNGGRLLVRGNNGTGKSRVLALQLPFLFDGEIASHRVEPDADPARQLVWHLLMDEHEQRTGYTWIEFGRRDEQGAEHYLTLGCGMKGVRGGDDQPKRWFFITEQRVGSDFQLLGGAYPHSKERLAEVLGDSCLFASAKDYRAEIDRRLFALGRGRYAALIELLIRLRAPQLSKKLDEKSIFTALSNALPPLSEEVVGPVADAFKQLDDLRQQFASLRSLQDSLEGFRSGYQTYLQMAIQIRAERVRTAHSAYESAQRKVNVIEENIQSAKARKDESEAHVQTAHDDYTGAEARYTALSTSSAAGDAKRLETAHALAQEKSRQASQAEKRAEESAQQNEREQQALAAHREEQQRYQQQRDQDWKAATQLSRAAGFSNDHSRLIPEEGGFPANPSQLEKLKADFKRLASDHDHRLKQIEDGLLALTNAQAAQAAAQAHENQRSSAVEAYRDDVRKHEQAAHVALKTLAENYVAWRDGLRWLVMPLWSELAPTFEDWLETADEQHRVLAVSLSIARNTEVSVLATARAELKAKRDQLHRDRERLRQEQASLAQQSPPPPPPRTRETASRQGRPGAPLWQVCEFRPGLTEAQRAGLEAALEAAGLLDAWIMPDGLLMGDFPSDTFLSVRDESTLHGETLENWLAPDLTADSGLSEHTLRRVLRHIGAGAGAGEHWVALDGCWQLGPVAGRGFKLQAEHLGATSREIARQKRLAEVAESLRLVDEGESLHQQEANQLDVREEGIAAESNNAPKDLLISNHLTLRTEARTKQDAASKAHDEAVQMTHRARQKTTEATESLRLEATHLGYKDHLDHLEELRPAWAPYDKMMVTLWGATQAWITASNQLAATESRERQAAETQAKDSGDASTSRTSAISANQAYEALAASLGSSVTDYQAKLTAALSDKESAQKKLDQANKDASESDRSLVAAQSSLKPAQDDVIRTSTERDDSIQALRVPLLHDLFSEAHPDLADIEKDMWSSTRAAAIARRIGKELPNANISEEAWTNRINLLNTQITDLSNRTGTACDIEHQVLSGGLTLVVCRYQGHHLRPASCLAAVEAERATHDRLLGEKERDIIDRHLVSEVSSKLQELMEAAQKQTALMNEEMSRCATTLGVTLRLHWEPKDDGLPPGLPAVRRLLLVDHGTWTEKERQDVGDCLHQLIQGERINHPTASASEQLLRALDYREWHAYCADRRHQGKWERLNKKRYGTLSQGEKALTLTIPQMAAAASHYRSAASHAPRFILLDEAFAGMDKPTRASCMGLLEAFDLDLVMTSEREWGAHATVSGIAIYQLVASADAIAATRWVWNGKTRQIAAVPDTPEFVATSSNVA